MELPLNEKIVFLSNDVFVEVSCHECGVYSKEGAGSKFKKGKRENVFNLFYFKFMQLFIPALLFHRVTFWTEQIKL